MVYEVVPSRAPAKEEVPGKHKAYGNVPKYLDKYNRQREDAVKQKAIDEENAKLPPGTRLMLEDERLATLEDLILAQKNTNRELERAPVVAHSLKMNKYKKELEEKLIRLDRAVETFSKQKVYVQIWSI